MTVEGEHREGPRTKAAAGREPSAPPPGGAAGGDPGGIPVEADAETPAGDDPVRARGRDRLTAAVGAAVRSAVAPLRVTGPLRRLYAAVAIDSLGLGMYLAFSALYLTEAVGLKASDAGLVLSISGLASLVGLVPLGVAADRMGARRALMSFFAYRAAAFAAIILAQSFVVALVTVAAAGLISRATGPVSQALVLQMTSSGKERVDALAGTRALRNAGFALGAVPAAVAVAIGTPTAYRVVLAVTVVAFLATSLLARGLPDAPVTRKRKSGRVDAVRDKRFLALTLVNGALTMHAFVLSIGLPLWLVRETSAPQWLAAVLLFVNTVLVVVLQTRFSSGSERPSVARRMMVKSGLVLAAVCALVPLSGSLPGVLAAVLMVALVIALTTGELWHTAGSYGLAVYRTPDGQQGGFMAVFAMGFTVATIVGPAVMGYLLDWGWQGWAALAGWFLLLSAVSRALSVTGGAQQE